jgi:hypothetical protein
VDRLRFPALKRQCTMLLVKSAILATTVILLTCCAPSCSQSVPPRPQPRQLFAAYIREGLGEERTINECQPPSYGMVQNDSELTVPDNGDVEYRISTGILCDDSRPVVEPDTHFGFRWKERLPEKVFRCKLSEVELSKFKAFLERGDVVRVESFFSAAPAQAHYIFMIGHLARPQNIEVIGFNFYRNVPQRFSGQHVSGLSAIICVAKDLAQRASKTTETPAWCQGVEPFASE